MIDFTQPGAIRDYFQAIATSHVDISDFVYGDEDVMASAVRSTDFGTVLWLDYPQPVRMIDRRSDDIEGRVPNTLMVITVSPSEKFTDEETTTADSEVIVRDILSKLYRDNQIGEITTEIADYIYGEAEVFLGATKFNGTRLDFNLIRSEKLTYNPAKWL